MTLIKTFCIENTFSVSGNLSSYFLQFFMWKRLCYNRHWFESSNISIYHNKSLWVYLCQYLDWCMWLKRSNYEISLPANQIYCLSHLLFLPLIKIIGVYININWVSCPMRQSLESFWLTATSASATIKAWFNTSDNLLLTAQPIQDSKTYPIWP